MAGRAPPVPTTPRRGVEGSGPMVCPICEPTDEDVSDLKQMGKLRKTASGGDLACLCISKVTSLGPKSVSFQNMLDLSRHASQSSFPVLTGCSEYENVYNTVEGNSDDEGMDRGVVAKFSVWER